MAERKAKTAAAASETKKKAGRPKKQAEPKAKQEKPVVEAAASDAPVKAENLFTVSCKSVLNVRAGAGKEFKIIRQIANGESVSVVEQQNGWGRIGAGEWVMLEFLK